jgi:hypothetical protein
MLTRNFLFVIFVGCSLFVVADEELTLQDVVRANESSIALVRSIEKEIDFSAERLLPHKISKQKVSSTYWAFDSKRERIIMIDNKAKPSKDGRTNNRLDIFRDGNQEKRLQNWDPAHPQEINPVMQGTVSAWIFPRHKRPRGIDPQEVLMFVFTPDGLSLSELVQGKASNVKFSRKVIDNEVCYQIRCSYKDSSDIETILDVMLKPKNKFMVSQMNCETIMKNQDGVQTSHFTRRTVTEFFHGNDGVCVPTGIKYESFSSAKLNQIESMGFAQIRIEKINQSLSKKAFDFIFPKDCQVSENPPVNGKVKVWLWGENNKPLREIKTPTDLLLGDTDLVHPRNNKYVWVGRIFILMGIILIILGIISFLKNRMKNK